MMTSIPRLTGTRENTLLFSPPLTSAYFSLSLRLICRRMFIRSVCVFRLVITFSCSKILPPLLLPLTYVSLDLVSVNKFVLYILYERLRLLRDRLTVSSHRSN